MPRARDRECALRRRPVTELWSVYLTFSRLTAHYSLALRAFRRTSRAIHIGQVAIDM